MPETRQQRRARERAAAKQANFDRVHTRVVAATTIGELWRLYRQERFERNGVTDPAHLGLLQEVFYSGVATAMQLFDRVAADSVSEDEGADMLQRLHEELDTYTRRLT